jgi:hypothetical protein
MSRCMRYRFLTWDSAWSYQSVSLHLGIYHYIGHVLRPLFWCSAYLMCPRFDHNPHQKSLHTIVKNVVNRPIMKTNHLKMGVKPEPKCHEGLISNVPEAMDDIHHYSTTGKPVRDF